MKGFYICRTFSKFNYKNTTMNNKLFFVILIFGLTIHTFAQSEVFESEVTQQGNLLYFKNKKFTGKLYSDEDNVPNRCKCLLEAKYKGGLLHGTKREWYSNGKLKFSGKYIYGKKTGTHIYYYNTGKKKEVQKYFNNELVEKTKYYSNGNIRRKEKFENGKVISSSIYNRDGSLKGGKKPKPAPVNPETPNKSVINNVQQETVQKPQTKTPKTSNVVTSTAQQAQQKPQNIITTTTNAQNGLQKSFYSNGNPQRIKFFKDGLLVKDSIFYDNGNLEIVKKYTDGELIHLEKYYPNNKIEKEENFLNNKKEGLQKTNYKDGQPKQIETYQSGMLTHLETYNAQGILTREENYKFDKKNGLQKTFDDTGNLKELKEFNMGILLRHERYTPKGKELIRISNGIAQIKTYNTKDKLTELRYENVKTKQPDSIYVNYQPETGLKLTEKAYANGKLIRKGQYLNDKKEGEWILFWKNGKKETHNFYSEGKLIKTRTLTYAKQIKNNYQKGDDLYMYKTYTPSEKNNYILIRFDSIKNKSEQFIKDNILEVIEQNNMKKLMQFKGIEEEELRSSIQISDIKVKLKSKKGNNKKFVTYINVLVKDHDYTSEKDYIKNYVITPATKRKPGINSHYEKDKKKAFFNSLQNLKQIFGQYISSKYPLSGSIRIKGKPNSSVQEVYANLGSFHGIEKGDIFNVLDKNGSSKAQIKVTSVMKNASIAKVTEGGKWLFTYYKTNKHPVIVKVKDTN